MHSITISDLEVFYRIGVTAEERSQPQRLLLTLELRLDFATAAASDCLTDTVDYARIVERLLSFGRERTWNLLEKLAADVANLLLEDRRVASVSVEAKKFVFPQARYVAVKLEASR